MSTDPWQVKVSGAVANPQTYELEDLLKGIATEERIYRLRCVEAWSMVVPWVGIPLKAVLDRLQPLGKAKYVEFKTLYRPKEMRGQRSLFSNIDWPYVEALRLDEAYHPLAIMAVGLYGKGLPNQNGAPWRLVVPWKYGFKSIKSVVGIRFSERQPKTTWNLLQSAEYGFYANVNPAVDHPRWSQSSERRLPSTLFSANKVPTLPFNGYAEEVADLYAGMDLRRNY
jgi:sulfoxide reductase catalytic subunit YedY